MESLTVSPEGNFKRGSAEEEEGEEGRVRGEGAIGLKVLTVLGCTWWGNISENIISEILCTLRITG